MENKFRQALEEAYGIRIDINTYGNGHINDTYITKAHPRYVIQRINHKVFTDPVGVMDNFAAVTDFLQKKIAAEGGDPTRETLNLVLTKGGKNHVEVDGNYFRAYRLVDQSYCYDLPETADLFCEAGKTFGHFQKLLQDFPADTLKETIPNFHNPPDRYRKLRIAIENDVMGRRRDVEDEIAFVEARVNKLSAITDAIREGTVPLRVTHNDTKINNVLFDEKSGKGLCVIDLDTVMPGSLLYDFGDAIRAGATTGAEDEKNLSKVTFRLDFYRAFREGFLSELGDCMTEKEVELLPLSAELITLECGMRFLTDHLEGDTYFRIRRPGQNLDRARTQFKLVADMEKMEDEMRK